MNDFYVAASGNPSLKLRSRHIELKDDREFGWACIYCGGVLIIRKDTEFAECPKCHIVNPIKLIKEIYKKQIQDEEK